MVLVTFTSQEQLDPYRRRNDVPFTILLDPDRSAYRSFGLGRGSVRRVYGWRAIGRYVALFRGGRLRDLRPATEDTLQLGGDFVIGPDGILVWGHWGEGPDDRPSVDDLVAAVRRAASG